MQEISVDDLAGLAPSEPFVLDVRTGVEYAEARVPGVVHVPMDEVPARLDELPDETIYVICASGHRSATVAEFLERAGHSAVNVTGGTHAWESSGRPVESG